MNNILNEILLAEKKLKEARELFKRSSFLQSIETEEDYFIHFNDHKNCMEIVVKYSYLTLMTTLQLLENEGITLKHESIIEHNEERHLVYGTLTDPINIRFSCKVDEIPEELKERL